MTSRVSLIIASSLVLLAACGGSSATEEADTPATAGSESARDTSFGFDEAIATTRAAHSTAIPIEVEHENDELIEVEFIRDGEVVKIYYSHSGEVVREEVETLDEEEAASLPILMEQLSSGGPTLEQALEVARRHYSSEELREVELEVRDESIAIKVELNRDGGREEYFHDAASGELITD